MAGTGTIAAPAGGNLNITQSSARGVIDWRSFSIGSGNTVSISNGAGATLNRVTGGSMSRINGALTATGSVYLVNPNGVVTGPGGKVLTGGSFVASTRDIATRDFMKGGAVVATGKSGGKVVNQGSITAQNGDVVLIGQSVSNSGTITAPKGTAALAAGDRVLLTTVGGPANIYVAADAATPGDVSQSGRIAAAAAALKSAGGNVYTLAGNRTGLVTATGTQTIGGQVWLSAPSGQVVAAGEISAQNSDGTGGKVVANGASVTVTTDAKISAMGSSGGSVLIGVSKPGSKKLAGTTVVQDGASIHAGGLSGGGTIETSGKKVTIGNASIGAGSGGQWFVDPVDLTIDPTAALTIVSSLNAGTNVSQITDGSGSGGAGDIIVAAPISWTGSGSLSFTAFHDLNINAAISGAGGFSASAGNAINVGANVSAATISLAATGNLTLASGKTLAASAITLQTSAAFINNAGSSALNGHWLVYSVNPSSDTTGGLTPDFYQYAAPGGTAAAGAGNGLLYSVTPSLTVGLSGTITKTYDGTTAATFAPTNAAVTGLINGDTAAVTGVYASKNAGVGIDVTATSIAATHAGAPVYGYAGTVPSVTAPIGTISKATLAAAIINDPTKIYNGTTTATLVASNYQLTGFAAGEGATVNQPSSVSYDAVDAGARTITATFGVTNFVANAGTSFSNYVLPTTATGVGHINPAALLIQGVLATDKTYDRTTSDALMTTGSALYGVIGSDDVSLVTAGASGIFATPNAGNGIAVTATGFTLSGAAKNNYLLVQPMGLTANISPVTLTVSGVSALNKVYDGNSAAGLSLGGAMLNGVISGDAVGLAVGSASGTFTSIDVGTGIAVSTAGFSLSGANSGNYRLTQPAGLSANITPAPLGIAIVGNPSKTYNGDAGAVVGASNFQLTGLVGAESIAVNQTSQVVYDTANAGTQNVTATLAVSDYLPGAGTKLSNYSLPATAVGTGTIYQAPITILLVGNPTKAYDGTKAASLDAANFQLSGFLAGQGASVTQTSGIYDDANVGARGVSATLGGADFAPLAGTLMSNYAFPTLVSGFGTITPASLGVGIYASIDGNPTKTYDGNTVATIAASDFTLVGFAPGDGAVINHPITGEYLSKNAGIQPVHASLLVTDFTGTGATNLSNYTLPTSAFGSGTINPATLTAAITGNPTRVYNGTTTASLTPGDFTVAGLAPGESIVIASAVLASYDARSAGSRTVTASFAVTDIGAGTGTLLSNYILPTSAAGPGQITQAPLVILGVSANDKTYDRSASATLSTGAAALYGVVGSDDVALSSASSSAVFASANAASGVAVTTSGFTMSGTDIGNYQLFQPTGLSATIRQAPVSISGISATNKVYDGLNTAPLSGSGTLVGILSGDGSLVTLDAAGATGTFSSVNVGSGLGVTAQGFALAGAAAANYALSQPGGLSASITARPLTASIIGNPSKVYDGSTSTTLTAANYQLDGFVGGQGATVPQSASANYAVADAGTQTITSQLRSSDFLAASGTNLSNYILPTTGTGTGTITQAPLTVSITGNPTRGYDATTAATLTSGDYTLTGFVTGQGASVTQTNGTYGGANAGAESVSATLTGSDYTASGSTNLANYLLPTTASGIGTINKAVLQVINVTATNKTYDGNTSDTLGTVAADVSGLFGSDSVTLDSSAAQGTFASKNAANGIAVSASGFAISGGASGNYTLAQPTGLVADISRATITLTKVERVYDATTDHPTASGAYTLSGIVSGDTVAMNTAGIAGGYGDKNVGTAKSISLTGLALTGADASNYSIGSSASGTIGVITQAPLTITNVTADDKVYDGTRSATLHSGSAVFVGLLGADDVVLDSSAAVGLFSDKNAATGKTVTASGYSISGTDFANYSFSQPPGITASITPYQALALVSVTKTYDGNTGLPGAGSAYVLGNFIAGDSVQIATATGTYSDKNVSGNLSVAGSFTLSGADAANYAIDTHFTDTAVGIINPKQLTAAIIGTPTKVYDRTGDATLSSANFSLNGFVSGEGATVTQTSGSYDTANAGNRTVSANLTAGDFSQSGGTLLSNYILPASASGAGKITPAPLTVTGVLATDKAYNGNTSDPLDVSHAALSGVIAGDESAVTLDTSSINGAFTSPNVGSWSVVASGFGLGGSAMGNYSLSQPTGLSANIVRAILTLASVTKVYDASDAAVGAGVQYTLAGVVGSEDVSLNTSGLSGTFSDKNVHAGKNVSLSGMALAGANASNYSIAVSVTNDPIGIITPAALTVTGAVAVNKTYDGSTAATIDNGAAHLVGILGSDGVSLTSPTAGTFQSANAGTWSVTASGNYTISGTDAANYTVTQPSGFSATIDRKTLGAAITGTPDKTYDGNTVATLTASDYTLSGFVGSEGAAVIQTSGTYVSANAGSEGVSATLAAGDFSATGSTNLANYVLPTVATGTGHIDPKALTAAITGTPYKTYDGNTAATLTSGDYSLSGFIGGQGASVTQTAGTFGSANAGSEAVSATLASGDFAATGSTNLANYVLPTLATGTGHIDPKALTAAITGTPGKTYDGNTAASLTPGDYLLSGFVAAEGASVTQTVGVYAGADAGTQAVSANLGAGDFTATGGTNLANYILPTTAAGAGHIDPKALVASITGSPDKTYDGNTSAALTSGDYSLTGFVAGQDAGVSQTVGNYASPNAGNQGVSAVLSVADFAAAGGTNLANYVLPTTANGTGHIDPKALTAAVTGHPEKAYDGTTAATLTAADYTLSGFITGEGATVVQTSGAYTGTDAGAHGVSATLTAGDFAAGTGTSLSNYTLPISASGTGQINPKQLIAIIVGAEKTYDANTAADLTGGNFVFAGFANGEGGMVTDPHLNGTYAAADAGSRGVTAVLGAGQISLNSGTSAANYILPVTAAGIGIIDPKMLTGQIVGTPAKTYDGTTDAPLTQGNYLLTGFVGSDTATVTKTAGTFEASDAGARLVSTTVQTGDFVAGTGTNLANYVLPTVLTGQGQIDRKALSASIVGNPTKMDDGSVHATLMPANYLLSGLVAGQGIAILQTNGTYDLAQEGTRIVSVVLGAGDFRADGGTSLSNYILPELASGPGRITAAIRTDAPTLSEAIEDNLMIATGLSRKELQPKVDQAVFAAATPRTYIPYPSPSALSTWQNNGFGSLPSIVDAGSTAREVTGTGTETVIGGPPIINTTEQILLQGNKDKSWHIVLTPISSTGASASDAHSPGL